MAVVKWGKRKKITWRKVGWCGGETARHLARTGRYQAMGARPSCSECLEIKLAQQPGDFVIGAVQDVYSVNPYRFCAQVEQQVANLPE